MRKRTTHRRPRQKNSDAKTRAKKSRGRTAESAVHGSSAAELTLDAEGAFGPDAPEDVLERPLPVVAIGASAGGLDAFSQVLAAMDEAPGVALVFVQHLAPQHDSALPSLLGGRTRLPVVQVTEGVRVEPDHVYVIPPNAQMEIRDGHLHLNPRPVDKTQYTPIDFFFRSLAETAKSGAIGVILSGSSSDGAAGLREIKAVGGITIAQDPSTTSYDSMPRAAIATDAVDLVLPLVEIGKEIIRIGKHPYVRHAQPQPRHVQPQPREDEPVVSNEQLKRLMSLLRNASGIDFTNYKSPTVRRRLQRRMVLHKIGDVGQYLRYMQTNPDEAPKLAQDILIHVTRFFRDPESFASLAEEVFPAVLAERPADSPVRIWVPGCSTGEEAYSVAITLLEHLGEAASDTQIQIFATDVSDAAVEHARAGSYGEAITADVSPERLRRFFTHADGAYRINKIVRDLCVFARQDLTRDPPFSKLDLIVCRNVLIYLGTALQRKLLAVFHYALNPTGFLMLGHAETSGSESERFSLVSKKHRLYRKHVTRFSDRPDISMHFSPVRGIPVTPKPVETRPTSTIPAEAQRLLLERYTPPGVIVGDDLRIIQFLGHTGRYLESPPGDATLTLPKMVRDGLLHGLRMAVQQARRENRPARRPGLPVRIDGAEVEVTLDVLPLSLGAAKDRHFLVLFREQRDGARRQRAPARGAARGRAAKDPRIAKLERELAASRDYLQSIIQELEAANEELQSANEEILSSNEELQSTNEELDTAKEELQSTNEELNTVNEELHGRNEELGRANSDLVNLLSSVQAALVIVDSTLRLRRFTPMAERILNLIPSDVGRPLSHLKPNIEVPNLEQLATQVIDTVSPYEGEVQDLNGRWFLIHVRPYKGIDNRIDGAVIGLFDIDTLKQHEADMKARHQYAEALMDMMREALLILDGNLRIQRVNQPFCQMFRVLPADTQGKFLYDLGNGQWNIPQLRTLLNDVLPRDRNVKDYRVEHEFPAIGRRSMRLNAHRLEGHGISTPVIFLQIEDVTDGAPAL